MEVQILEVQELELEHDPEKWKPVFRKDHAQTKKPLAQNLQNKSGAEQAPDRFQPSPRSSPIVAMMAPVMVVPMAMVTDASQTVMGPDHPAVWVSVIRRRIIEVAMEMVPKRVVPERKAVMVESSAMKGCAPRAAATMVTPTAMVTAAAVAATTVAAADFCHEPVGSVFRYRHRSRIGQRQRLGALAGYGGQRQQRDRRKSETAAKRTAVPGNWILRHV